MNFQLYFLYLYSYIGIRFNQWSLFEVQTKNKPVFNRLNFFFPFSECIFTELFEPWFQIYVFVTFWHSICFLFS